MERRVRRVPLPEPGAPFWGDGRRGVREMGKKKGERECYLPMTEMSIGLGGWVQRCWGGCW